LSQQREVREDARSQKKVGHPALIVVMIVLSFGMAIWQGLDACRIHGPNSWGRAATSIAWLIFGSVWVIRFAHRKTPEAYWRLVRGQAWVEKDKEFHG
jgi:hypothetical protein